jgi:hypothetical protein
MSEKELLDNVTACEKELLDNVTAFYEAYWKAAAAPRQAARQKDGNNPPRQGKFRRFFQRALRILCSGAGKNGGTQ